MRVLGAILLAAWLTACGTTVSETTGTVTGTVVISPCRPVERAGDPPCPPSAGVRVHFDGGPQSGATVLTDAAGTYLVSLTPGSYQVWAEGGIIKPRPVTVTVAPRQTVTLNLTVDSGIR